MFRVHLGLAVLTLFLCSACGRLNFDPVPLSGDRDADISVIDADQATIDAANATDDGGTSCTSAALSGSYVGDGANGRIIDTGVQPLLVIVQSDAGQEAVVRMSTMPNDRSKSLVGAQIMLLGLISHASNGFAVSGDARVNAPGQTYHWLALPLAPGISHGEYDGNGTSQVITGLGFAPEWILFVDEDDGAPVVRMPQPAALTFRLDDGTGVPDGVHTLDADGFTLGGRPLVNAVDHHFHFVAWRSTPGTIATGNYTGDDGSMRAISGLGFAPSYAMVHGLGEPVTQRFKSLPQGAALPVTAQTPIAQTITGFVEDGFTLGSHPATNELGTEYTYSAFATCP